MGTPCTQLEDFAGIKVPVRNKDQTKCINHDTSNFGTQVARLTHACIIMKHKHDVRLYED